MRRTVPGVGGELLVQHGVLPAHRDGLLMTRVSVFERRVPLLTQVLHRLSEVSLDQIYHGFLLSVECLQSFEFTYTQDRGTVMYLNWVHTGEPVPVIGKS